jgi:CheY-like chemotaxis protein
MRTLIIEDNRDAGETLAFLLKVVEHDTAVAYTGTDGGRKALEWHPDVVLCDIGLPGLNGYEVARTLRRNPATQQDVLIAITGYSGDEEKRNAQAAGFDFFFTKPVDVLSLLPLLSTAKP